VTSPTPYEVGPFDSSHLYVQWGGLLPGEETWSCGFRMWQAGGSTPQDANDALVGVSAAIAEFHVRPNTMISPKALLQYVKVNAIGTNGKYTGDATVEAIFGNTPGGGVDQKTPPNQVALAVSTTTGFSRGPAHRGRFFLPLPCITIFGDGRMDAGDAGLVKASANVLRTGVNAAGGGHVMTVMSRKKNAPGHRAITGFEVGRVLDTQRRRRRSLLESYA
jgi:hypothetical protein